MTAEPLGASVAMLIAAANSPTLPPLARGLARLAALSALWSERARTRRALRDLPDHRLADIGISRTDAERESLKRFWMP